MNEMQIGGKDVRRPTQKEIDALKRGDVVGFIDAGSSMHGLLYYFQWLKIDFTTPTHVIGSLQDGGVPLNGGPMYERRLHDNVPIEKSRIVMIQD